MKLNIQDIIGSEHLEQREDEEFAGLRYSSWNVVPPLFSDQIESLLENGFMVSIMTEGIVVINQPQDAPPEMIMSNKKFWRELSEAIGT